MISKRGVHSISTVQFKKQLPVVILRSLSYGSKTKASRLRVLMLESGLTQYPSAHLTRSFCSLALGICAGNGFFLEVKQLHSHVIKLGIFEGLSIQNQVLHGYAKCGEFRDAGKLFDEMPVRNVVSWNTVVCGVASRGKCDGLGVGLVMHYFRRMLLEMVRPDSTTMNALIRACIESGDLGIGRHLHGFVMRVGLGLDCFVGSAIVDLYGKLGLVRDARCAFDEIEFKDLVSWNVVVSAYALNGLTEEALGIFGLMQLEGFRGDQFTFTSLLVSCSLGGCSELGKQFHGLTTKLSFNLETQVGCVLVDMYAKNGLVNEARKMFDGMLVRNLVCWNTMIVGYGQHGYVKEAMELFVEMSRRNVNLDELTVASIVSSCGNLSSATEISQIHALTVKSGFDSHLSVANALIVAYSNSGSLPSASRCFNSVKEPDLVTWTSLLTAHAFHGKVEESIKIFDTMLLCGLRPDHISFLGILSACSHGGLIREGLYYYKLMVSGYNITPNSEHDACLVDLLGRAGLVNEASSILSSGANSLELNTLGALIGASKAHGHVKLAEWASGKLFELEPDNPVNYTLMSNMYASVGQWKDAARVRKIMNDKCGSKVPGCSWIEIAGKVHTFLSNDISHPLTQEVYSTLGMLTRLLKEDDYVNLGK